jgi:hypothetical protein
MKRTVVFSTVVLVILGGAVLAIASRVTSGPLLRSPLQSAPQNTPAISSASVPVLVELFTSEGCSSCPPADALLAQLAKRSEVSGATVIPLEEHVDYWNHLGWADPFSNSRYSVRQRAYAQLLRLDQVYTPQMVVNGRTELLGSDANAAHAAIINTVRAATTDIKIEVNSVSDTNVTLKISAGPISTLLNDEITDIIIAITEDNLQSNVLRGENVGRKLSHVGVVRSWQTIGHSSKTSKFSTRANIDLDSSWKRTDLHAVVFVQGHDSGRVYGAATVKSLPRKLRSDL